MADPMTTVSVLREAMRRFVAERDWEQFHSPKNLVMGLSVEAAELMEHFLWVSNEESHQVVHDPARLGEVADEMADVALYLLALCNTLGIDLSEAIVAKIAKNAIKHGLEPKAEGGALTVSAEVVHGKLAVTVVDTGVGFARAATAGTGMGLQNIRERLKLIYGDAAELRIAGNAPSGTRVTIVVPYKAT